MWSCLPFPLLRRGLCALIALGLLGACSDRYDTLAPMTAQPDSPAARNITSFTPALQCMDGLLARAGRGALRITATQIPDRTRSISVGAEDMLINAISQMNRRSGAYVFVDQGVVKQSSGALLRIEYDDLKDENEPAAPSYYISGSISQVDADVRDTGITTDYGRQQTDPYGRRLGTSDRTTGRSNSVVTVDLHLVAYPSRQVVPGASVSNSMVVTHKSFGTRLTGHITQKTLGLRINVQRLESRGQAVRNLIELGVIELLGTHARLPYWQCLAQRGTDARVTGRQERAHVAQPEGHNLREAQDLLIRMGRLAGPATGSLDRATRQALAGFQAERQLVAHGQPDFDTLSALRETVPAPAPRPAAPPVRRNKTVMPTPAPKVAPVPKALPPAPVSAPPVATGGYTSISSFLD